MKLFKVREAVTWIDPWGDRHSNQAKYVRVFEVVEPVKIKQKFEDQIMLNNGYEPPYPVDVYALPDGRKWVEMTNHVDYSGGTWYRPLFKDDVEKAFGVYDQADEHTVGPRITWLTERGMQTKRCVNADGRAVDIEGNPL